MNRINNTSIRVRLIFSISAPFLVGNQPEDYVIIVGWIQLEKVPFNPAGLFYYNQLCCVYYSMSNDEISITLSL